MRPWQVFSAGGSVLYSARIAAICFVNTNPPEKRVQVLLSDKKAKRISRRYKHF